MSVENTSPKVFWSKNQQLIGKHIPMKIPFLSTHFIISCTKRCTEQLFIYYVSFSLEIYSKFCLIDRFVADGRKHFIFGSSGRRKWTIFICINITKNEWFFIALDTFFVTFSIVLYISFKHWMEYRLDAQAIYLSAKHLHKYGISTIVLELNVGKIEIYKQIDIN